MMDDLITTGGSLINAAKAIRAEGGVVNDAVVLIDREEGGKEILAKEEIRLHSLTKMSEVARILLKAGTLSSEQYKSIIRQVKGR
jgi:orotate phosphoribosyltransferase